MSKQLTLFDCGDGKRFSDLVGVEVIAANDTDRRRATQLAMLQLLSKQSTVSADELLRDLNAIFSDRGVWFSNAFRVLRMQGIIRSAGGKPSKRKRRMGSLIHAWQIGDPKAAKQHVATLKSCLTFPKPSRKRKGKSK